MIDPILAQQLQRRLVLDELRHGRDTQTPGDLDHPANQHLVDLADRQVADEVTVDLEEVERQVLEVVEGAEAGAEVVERETAPEPAQGRGELTRLRHVGGRRCLAHLEDRRRGSTACSATVASIICGISGSPIERSDVEPKVRSLPRTSPRAISSIALRITQRSTSTA